MLTVAALAMFLGVMFLLGRGLRFALFLQIGPLAFSSWPGASFGPCDGLFFRSEFRFFF